LLLPAVSHGAVREWIGRPWNAVLIILFAAMMAWHSSLGVQVVIEDYVHQPFARVASLILSRFVHTLLAAAAVIAVLDIAFGAVA
jgi:succinate dehydrogenase / fumarate reductase membrane anchor subunit